MEVLATMFQDFFSTFTSYPPLELIVEMGVIWLCVFLAFRFLRGTRGAGVVKGFAILLAMFMVLARSPLFKAGCPQQLCARGTRTRQPARSSKATAANATCGRIRSARQVTNNPTLIGESI